MFNEYERRFSRRYWAVVIMITMVVLAMLGLTVCIVLTPAMVIGNSCKAENDNEECCPVGEQQMQVINSITHLCCNNTVTRRSPLLGCCYQDDGSRLYNKKEFKCCKGRLRQKLHGDDDSCCGDKLYNIKTGLCCPLKHHMHIVHKVYEITTTLKVCPVHFCNNTYYNTTKNTCCNGTLFPNLANHTCCGKDLFNTETKICCNGKQFWKEHGKEKCCGMLLMDKGQTCCGGEILEKNENCCGEQKYNSRVSLCTAGSKVVPLATPLCNNRKYDPEKQVCCGSFPMTKNKPGDNACCKPRGHRPGITFNNQNMTCRSGRVYSSVRCALKHTPDHYTCCNGFAYEQPAKDSVCCDGRAESSKQQLNQGNCQPPMCDNKWFDSSKFDCCNNRLINRQRFRCIGDKVYIYYTRKDRFSDDLTQCGPYAISKSYDCCAELMPYKSNSYNCPFKDFGNRKPIKPQRFPFWPIIECRSEKMVGKIVKITEIRRKLRLAFEEKSTRKLFNIEVSNIQGHKINLLKYHKVIVYYEKSEKNKLYLGAYGAIRKSRRRRYMINSQDKESCEKINLQFQTNSS